MKNRKSSTFILAGILLVGIVALGGYLFCLFGQPLGQPLALKPRLATTTLSVLDGTAPSMALTITATVGTADFASNRANTILIIGSDVRDMPGTAG